ncbi:tRNA (N6-threonylcarbamoyladenosine(37)-N6)-methyltransferase TrmO [Prolixibacteraceae bacterium Z1-6]|uniref:tRNA (N6-threonylcarbamoyladenosine(37)-N6)-methyltransferase TrmO n=1 Tax=Draconibacterium aestuarii TaxID=2998507 RepID=A0A9X3FCH8_9BACT|nr:tRNA (N6-threonylcarbamoyladenosine(37)-N6)-methyltransferase TrmO [Prolixibacteraceae bacterium Z1-6]
MKALKNIELKVIGKISTPHKSIENIPVQAVGGKEYTGVFELVPELAEGLRSLEGFSHMILLFHLHKIKGYSLMVKPFMDDKLHGVFATRSPKRPSPIGLSTVKILKVEGNKVNFEGADMLDGSPLIDIKPFFSSVDNVPDAISGWLETKDKNAAKNTRSDNRFA